MRVNFFSQQFDIKKINLTKHYTQLDYLTTNLKNTMDNRISQSYERVAILSNHLSLVNPKSILKRGYAIVKKNDKDIVHSSKDVKHHQRLEVILSEDTLSVIVDKKYDSKQAEIFIQ